jgi:acetyl-CoA carboxylase carboxyl transferase subunit beta
MPFRPVLKRLMFRNRAYRLYRKRYSRKKFLADERSIVSQTHTCPSCGKSLSVEELSAALFVCPACSHHFRITPFERLKFLADDGVFYQFPEELEGVDPLEFPGYKERIAKAKRETAMSEAVISGILSIKNRRAIVSVMSFSFLGGSMGSVVGELITRAIVKGIEERLPVIIFTASGGARMQEGIFSLMQMAKTANAIAALEEEHIPLFIVLTDPTTGGVTASFAMLGNVILAEPEALIGFAGPRVIEGTIRQKLPDGFQRSEFHLQKGFVDMIVHRKDLRDTLTFLIDTHPIHQVS